MRVFSYSEARKRFAEVLDLARNDEVLIKRRNGETFSLKTVKKRKSPFDIDGLETDITTAELVAVIRESRERWNNNRNNSDR